MDEREIAAAVFVDIVKQRLQLAAVIEASLDFYADDAATGRELTSAWFLLHGHHDLMT